MKKKIAKIIGLVILLLLGLFLLILTPDGRYYGLLLSWSIGKPDIYYMELQITENYEDSYIAVVVDNNRVVSLDYLERNQHDAWLIENGYIVNAPWLSEYGYTIDAIYESGRDFCFPVFECLIRIDSIYDYPRVLAFEGQGIVVRNFQSCESLDECMGLR